MRQSVRRQLVAIFWMLGGSSLVFALLLIMNEYIDTPKPEGQTVSKAFEIERPKPPQKPKPKKRKMEKRKRQTRKAPRPAAPRLGAALSGLDFGLPTFDASQIGAVSDSILGNMEDIVMTEDSVDSAPVARQRGGVEYPKRAREKGITGFVTLSVLIGSDGVVERVKVLEAEPPEVFNDAAIRAVKGWSFEPALYKGKPVKIWARQTLRFDLQ